MRISWAMEVATEVMEGVMGVLEVTVGLEENKEVERKGSMEVANINHFKVERVILDNAICRQLKKKDKRESQHQQS